MRGRGIETQQTSATVAATLPIRIVILT